MSLNLIFFQMENVFHVHLKLIKIIPFLTKRDVKWQAIETH